MVQNCFLENIVRQSLLGTEFGFLEILTVLNELYGGKGRSNCELNMQCLLIQLVLMTQTINHLCMFRIQQRRQQKPDKSP